MGEPWFNAGYDSHTMHPVLITPFRMPRTQHSRVTQTADPSDLSDLITEPVLKTPFTALQTVRTIQGYTDIPSDLSDLNKYIGLLFLFAFVRVSGFLCVAVLSVMY